MQLTLNGYCGRAYLAKVTEFMTECRKRSPLGGLWDTADLQWWWRDDAYGNPDHQLFLETRSGRALGFILLSEQHETFDYEILPGYEESQGAAAMFRYALDWLKGLTPARDPGNKTFFIRDSHSLLREIAEAEGFGLTTKSYVQTALNLPVSAQKNLDSMPANIRPIRESDLTDGHPPVLRTSAAGFARVRDTSLYRAEYHLVGLDQNVQAVAECICWLDEVNRIGVFEPVETLPHYRRQGYGSALLREGLRRFTADGGKLAKVSHYNSNLAASGLYESLGFRPLFERVAYASDV